MKSLLIAAIFMISGCGAPPKAEKQVKYDSTETFAGNAVVSLRADGNLVVDTRSSMKINQVTVDGQLIWPVPPQIIKSSSGSNGANVAAVNGDVTLNADGRVPIHGNWYPVKDSRCNGLPLLPDQMSK